MIIIFIASSVALISSVRFLDFLSKSAQINLLAGDSFVMMDKLEQFPNLTNQTQLILYEI